MQNTWSSLSRERARVARQKKKGKGYGLDMSGGRMEYQDRIFHSMVVQRRPGKIPGQGRFTTTLVVRTNAGVYCCHLERLCHQIHDEFPNHCQKLGYFFGI